MEGFMALFRFFAQFTWLAFQWFVFGLTFLLVVAGFLLLIIECVAHCFFFFFSNRGYLG